MKKSSRNTVWTFRVTRDPALWRLDSAAVVFYLVARHLYRDDQAIHTDSVDITMDPRVKRSLCTLSRWDQRSTLG